MKIITIGRSSKNEIVLNDPLVSRRHAKLVQRSNDVCTLSDMGSRNGTYVNGRAIRKETILHVGDSVKLGNSILPWEQYLSPHKIPAGKVCPWIGGIAAAVALILVVVGVFWVPKKDFYFTGEYPPVKTITITENGRKYNIEAVSGHILLFFKDGVSRSKAKQLIKQNGGRIIEQMPKFDYYLVRVVEGAENNFIAQMRQEPNVEYVFLNTISSPTAFSGIIDCFDKTIDCSHGMYVKEIFEEYNGGTQTDFVENIFIESTRKIDNKIKKVHNTPWNKVITSMTNFIKKSGKQNFSVLNMSIGSFFEPKDKKEYFQTTDTNEKRKYEDDNIYKLKNIAENIEKLEQKGYTNFIITKSSGNEGMYSFDDILNQLDPKTINILQRHLVLVNARDTRDTIYSNMPRTKHPLMTTIDISNDKKYPKGTSFAAPKLAAFINKIHNKYKNTAPNSFFTTIKGSETDIFLTAIHNATHVYPRKAMSENELEEEVKKILNINDENEIKKLLELSPSITMTTLETDTQNIGIAGSGIVIIDWGDGTANEKYRFSEKDHDRNFSHHYSGKSPNTITIYGENITGLSNGKSNTMYGTIFGKITNLNVNKCTTLTCLSVRHNQLTSLDVSNNTVLEELDCYGNQLTSLDVSKNTVLRSLVCGGNQLTSLDVSNNTVLEELDCFDNQLTSLDISKNTVLRSLNCGGNQLTSLDVSRNKKLITLHCYSSQLTSLNVNNATLEELRCECSQLTNIDLSRTTALTRLDCYENQLTSLDLSKNKALEYLRCFNNQLTSLDASKNAALKELECGKNQITNLDVSNCVALHKLSCDENQLTNLDLSKNIVLESLYCPGNKFSSDALNTLFSTLHNNQKLKNKVIVVQDNPGAKSCKTKIATNKGWEVYAEW